MKNFFEVVKDGISDQESAKNTVNQFLYDNGMEVTCIKEKPGRIRWFREMSDVEPVIEWSSETGIVFIRKEFQTLSDDDNGLVPCRIRWKDSGEEEDVLIDPDIFVDDDLDDGIFFYGMSREDLISAMKSGTLCEGEWYVISVDGKSVVTEIDFELGDWTEHYPTGTSVKFADGSDEGDYCDNLEEFKEFIGKYAPRFTVNTMIKFTANLYDIQASTVNECITGILETIKEL